MAMSNFSIQATKNSLRFSKNFKKCKTLNKMGTLARLKRKKISKTKIILIWKNLSLFKVTIKLKNKNP